MKLIKLILVTVSCLALTACPGKNKGKSKPSFVKEQVVLGDPIEVVRGAQFKPQGAFEAFNGLNSVHIFASYEILEKGDAVDSSKELSQDEIEKEEAPAEKYEGPESYDMTIERPDKNTLVLYNAAEKIKFIFKKNKDGSLTYTQHDDQESETGTILHFSQHKDGNIFSILTYGTSQNSKSLTGLYFAKKFNPQVPPQTAKPFSYLDGPGYKVRWKQKQVTVDLCGKQEEFVSDLTAHAITEWNSALGKKLNIEYRESEKYYPFTDLNQHCIYIVDNLRFDADPRSATYAATSEIRDYEKSALIDADILVFKKEFEKSIGYKFGDEALLNEAGVTFIHEIGHFLGLDHVFEEGVKSIMGYDLGMEPKLQPIDIEAIKALYE